MIKTVSVRATKEYEINLGEKVLSQDFITEFESYMWELDGDTLQEKQNKLYEFAAQQIARGEEEFIEGLGHIASVRTVKFKQKDGNQINVVWNDTVDEIETEIVG